MTGVQTCALPIWMLGRLAGIDQASPGFKQIVIRPSPPTPSSNPDRAPINWVKAHYDSIYGRITSNWKRSADTFELETTIPANTTATVYLPTTEAKSVTESGRLLAKVKGIKSFHVEGGHFVMAVESGTYRFSCNFKK